MADDKIQISWAEVASAEVDAKLKHQAAVGRAQEHYQQQPQPTLRGPEPAAISKQKSGFCRHSVVYMSLFGLIGGLCAWASGEIAWHAYPNQLVDFIQAKSAAQQVDQRFKAGEITKEQAEKALASLAQAVKDNPYFKIDTDPALAEAEKDRQENALYEKDSGKMIGSQLAVYGACGLFLGFWLAIADSVVGRNQHGVIVHGATGAILGLVGGIIVSLFINQLYQSLGGGSFSLNFSLGKQIVARSLGWAILGSFLAIAPGIVLKSWKRFFIGLAGGFLGGLLGGSLFDPIGIATGSDILSRFVAILAIGVLTGLGTGLIENVAKSGWLRVVAGLIAGKQFVLYRNPTYIGSSPQCEIYLFKDVRVAPRHAAIHMIPGGFEIEDLQSASGTFLNGQNVSRQKLKSGDQLQIGATAFAFGEKRK